MQKKPKKCFGDRYLSKAGICFEALEPRLLLSGSWGAVVDGPGPDAQTDAHGGFILKSMVSKADAGFSAAGKAQINLTPGSGRIDLLSKAPVLNNFGNAVSAFDASPASIPAAPITDIATALSPADNQAVASNPESHSDSVDAAVRRELVFVNDDVDAYEILINGIRESDTDRTVEIVVIDADRDGIQQVSDILAERSDLSAVHVIAHGSEGRINLGNSWLNSAALEENSDAVAGWGSALTETGDILFYGCNIAADSHGQGLLDDIARLTGADVAASDDNTGHISLSGDWELEHASGAIESVAAVHADAQGDWSHLLAAPSDLQATATTTGGLSLNEDGGNDAYLLADDGGAIFESLTELTIEAQFSATSAPTANYSDFVSYATSSQDEEVWLAFRRVSGTDFEIQFAVNGDIRTAAGYNAYSLFDGEQHALSVTWNSSGGAHEFFIDGASVYSNTGLKSGYTLQSGGELTLVRDQDTPGGDFDLGEFFQGTLHDMRIFDNVRSDVEISTNYRSTLPYDEPGMLANWTFDDFSLDATTGKRIVTDTVSGNNLTAMNVGAGGGYITSTPELTFAVDENSINGTVVGTVAGTDPDRDATIASLLAADSELHYNAETGKFYKYTNNGFVLPAAAIAEAEGTMLNGINGQLVTIRSAYENEYVKIIAASYGSDVWLGGTDATVEGEWRWIESGSEADLFWSGDENGSAPSGVYQNWVSGSQPNNTNGGEAFVRMDDDTGLWYDDEANARNVMVEWKADDVLDTTDPLTYSIQSQTVAGAFAIDADSGQITVADGSLLDYETNAVHTVTVRTSDGSLTYEKAFTISLAEVVEFVVINTTDSGAGSLRQAIIDANANTNSGGPDHITFNIGADGTPQTINLLSPLDPVSEAVIIDGFSQYGALTPTVPIIEINGASAGAVDGIVLDAGSDGSTIQGLIINRFDDAGIKLEDSDNHTIVGNYIGTDAAGTGDRGNSTFGIEILNSAGNLIGGSTAADRNVIAGNSLDGITIWGAGSTLNVIQGNYIGVDATGDSGLGNGADGIVIGGGANNNTIGGDRTAGEGNVISGQIGANSDGIEIDNTGANNNKIHGNYIGTNFDGTAPIANARNGVVIYDGVQGTQIGGTGTGQGNIISGNAENGVVIDGNGKITTSGNIVAGNYIGVDVNGTGDLGNTGNGVEVFGLASGNLIGGEIAGAGNTIAFNTQNGVEVADGTNNAIVRNSIHSNTLLGIDLGSGANNDQNFPVLTSAETNGPQIIVTGTLNSIANTSFRIEFYSNATGDGTGYGEGQTLIGISDVTTDGSGNALFSFVLPASVSAGSAISATVSRLDGGDAETDTSEFAQNVIATAMVNTAPVLNGPGLYLTSITEDPTVNNGNLVSSILASTGGDPITDVDAGAVEGIAIFDLSNSNGTWQYDIGTGWINVGSVSVASSLLLRDTDSLRFVPNADWNGTELMSFAAWDQTSGAAGTKVDTSTYGGSTAFSTGTAIPSIAVTAVNDAPTLWSHHRTTTLSAATALTDYPVQVQLDASFDYINAQANGEDIRFFDAAGNELSYWIEDWNSGGTSTIWIKVATPGTTTLEMFYGNSSVSSASDADATFLFYDNFVDGTAGSLPVGWTPVAGATTGTLPSVKDDAGNLVFSDGVNSGGPVVSAGNWADVVVSQDFRTINASDPINHAGLIARYADVDNMVYGGIITKDTAQIWYRNGGTFTQIGGDWSITALNVDDANWHSQELRLFGDTVELFIDDTFIGSASLAASGAPASGSTGFWSQYNSGGEAYRDNHIVRCYDAGTGDIGTSNGNEGYAINENSANGTVIGHVIASDPDIGDVLSYNITAGNTGSAFDIDNNGQITVNNSAVLDFETTPSFTLTVQVDDGNGLTDTGTLTITLNNVNDAPTGSVTISGTPTEDQVLTAGNTLADEDGLGAISYQWQRDGSDIVGATGATYTLTQSDVSTTITVIASYTDGQGTAESVSSAGVGPIANLNNAPTGTVTISGTPTEDQTLTAGNTLADADGMGAVSYQWQRDGSDIGGATGGTYTLTQADVGSTITVIASYIDGQGTAESATSAGVGPVVNVNDAPTGSVTISGTPTEDQVLTAGNTLADEDGLGPITYQWQRGGVDIGGATGSTYTLTQADVGTTITVIASYTDGQSTAESAASAGVGPVANVNDAPTGSVTISGTPTEDQVLTAGNTLADEDGLGPITYQWQRGGVDIGGATGSTYTLTQADVGTTITVIASYTDGQSTAESAASAGVGPVANVNDAPTGSVTISGTPTEDQVLTAGNTLADEDGLGAISYQWQRDGSDIVGATGATYTLTQSDVSTTITVIASYTDGQGTAESVSSAGVGPIANLNNAPTGTVTISGTPTEDQTLTAGNTLADADGMGAVSYQWQRDGSDIGGATGGTYTLTQADVGSTITVIASYIDGQGTAESATSAGVGPVVNVNDAPTGSVTISGTPTEDQVLTAGNTLADEDGLGPITYQWQRGGVDIGGATGSTYTLTQADVGTTITVIASYTDGQSTAESAASAGVGPVANVNDAPTGSVTISGTPTEDQVLTAGNTLADEDGLGAISYQWQRDGSDIVGATGATYTLTQSDVSTTITVIASYTDGQGTAESVSSAGVGPIANLNNAPTGTVTISGTPTEDQTLTAGNTLADADGMGAVSYQWQRDGSDIGGATGGTYTLTQADVGSTITVIASYIDGQGTAESATSAGVGPVVNVNDAPTGSVTISGTPTEDQVLTAGNTLADEDGLGPITYQWQRGGVDIGGATGSTYTLTQADVGTTITVIASYTDGQSTAESAASAGVGPVANVNDAPTGSVTISGTPTEDQVLTAGNTLADEDGLGAISYQWQRDGSDIVGATGATYTLTQSDVSTTITVIASYTDGQGTAESVSSAGVGPIANLNNAPTIAGVNAGAVTKNIDPDGDGLLEVGGVLTISDPDPAESSFQAGTVIGAYGSLTIDAAGNWNYAADNTQAVIQQLNTGESISDVLTVTTADGTTHSITVTINGATAIVDQGGDDPGPGPGVDPIEPDPEPEPELPPEEILPVEDELPPREELAISDIPSSKLPAITPLQWADPTYFVPTISMLTTDNVLPTDDGSPSAMVSIVKFLQRELASETIERVASSVSALFSSDAMTQTLDLIQQQLGDTLEMDGKRGKLIIGAATGLGASVFAGYVIWAFRGSSLLLGALTAMPMWRCFDPLPVLMGDDKKRRELDEAESRKNELDKDETTVRELLGEKQAAKDIEDLSRRND